MSSVGVKEAKSALSGLVDDAASGEFVTITRHGKPAAVLVSVEAAEAAKRALAKPKSSFGNFLIRYPGGAEMERNQSGLRDVEF
ncbi:type II toxin-antitoxin system Phd/YefM family antitoxin [Agrobacterium sp. ES01]|uniref:type II toxin-antitoxin system Phd/YefM family antitoxin n=1 Tax=Agrobacterium sp. ES01 TaxID=3420714 RepID=UPI003D09F8C7